MCIGVWSIGEASQVRNSRFKLIIEDSHGPKLPDDSGKDTPSSEKVKRDIPQSIGIDCQLGSPLGNLVPRALNTNVEIDTNTDVEPITYRGTEEDGNIGPILELGI